MLANESSTHHLTTPRALLGISCFPKGRRCHNLRALYSHSSRGRHSHKVVAAIHNATLLLHSTDLAKGKRQKILLESSCNSAIPLLCPKEMMPDIASRFIGNYPV